MLATFTGPGTLGFHVQSAIAEVFKGGGGNVEAQINTFVAATVEVCYTYGVAAVSAAPPTVTRAATPSATPSPPVVAPAPFTG